jgi:hypothetical protein
MNEQQKNQSNLLQKRISDVIEQEITSRLTGSDFFKRKQEGFMGNAGESFGDLPEATRTSAVFGMRSGYVDK